MVVARLAAVLMIAVAATAAAPPNPPISDIHVIPIKPGVNTIPRFAADGRPATIVQAWRGNGNAHGYNVFLVMLPGAEGHGPGVVRQQNNDSSTGGDAVRDDPFDGERVLGVVRFARARLGGKAQTVMIKAHLDDAPGRAMADPATATIRVYALSHNDGAVGDTPNSFVLAWTGHTAKRYCHAELALRDVLHVPLSKTFAGFNKVDGCG